MIFFLDLWHDLREKRLWPVAVGLLAAIIAVPVILFKPASDAAPPATVVPQTGKAETLPVVSVDSGPTEGSRLEAYSAKNPFKPMKDLAKDTTTSTAKSGASGDTAAGGSTSSGSGSTLANPGGDAASGNSSSPTGGTTPPTTSTPNSGTTQTTRFYRYTADFKFGKPGTPKTFKNTSDFTLLPNDKTPAIVFIGIDSDQKHAMFFISDPGVEAAGEGKCNASGTNCRFVTLSVADTNDQETFSAIDGSVTYDLKLLKINREELATDKNGDPIVPSAGKTQTAAGEGVAAATESTQALIPGMFGDGPALLAEQK
jgi:hypothetical protein